MSQISCSYSFQVLNPGTSCCTIPMILKTTLAAPYPQLRVLWKTRAWSPATYMIPGRYTISTVCSLQFVAVNWDNVKDVVSVHTVVWAIDDVALYRGLTVIYPNNTGWPKSLCELMITTHVFLPQSNCLAADRQGQGDTRLTLTPSVISNSKYVIMVSDWNCLKYFCVFLYCNHQVHRDFLITLYFQSSTVKLFSPVVSW
jgi:hypothetical protein